MPEMGCSDLARVGRGGRIGRAALAAFALLLVFAATTAARAEPTVFGARIGEHGKTTRFVLDVSEKTAFSLFSLDDPYRVVIDLPAVNWAIGGGAAPGGGLIKRFRFGSFSPTTSRMVLDLAGPATVESSFVLPPSGEAQHYRLVIDLVPVSAEEFARQAALSAPPPPAAATPVPTLKPEAPEGKRIVVVDAGHGGVDPGAIGHNGTYEKLVTLAAAKELKSALEATGRYVVVLTRERDIFVSLRDRVEIGRHAGAELFISLHADSHDSTRLRGASVYTLSEKASDKEAAELAARENKSDIIAGLDLSDQYDDDVAAILITLTQRETMNCSATFATLLVPELGKKLNLLNHSHRSAGFRVLKAPDMPSILIEMGYLSNVKDEAMLRSPAGRAPLVEGIVEAVDRFFAKKHCWT